MYDDLSNYLATKGRVSEIGPERGPSRMPENGIVLFRSSHGSWRYLLFEDGQPVSVLQIVSRDGKHGQIANVFTAPERRRRGLAERLLKRAHEDFEVIVHSTHLSGSGRRWKEKVSRDVDVLKLAWESSRRGRRGSDALQVLQDFLLERYGPQFRDAQRYAKLQKKEHYAILFVPQLTRWSPIEVQRQWGEPSLRAVGTEQARFSPFRVLPAGRAHHTYRTSIVVWDTWNGFDVHHLRERSSHPYGVP